MPSDLAHVARRWTDLGAQDPMWAALTDGRASGSWNPDEFLATGRQEIDSVLAVLASRGVAPRCGTALDFGCGPGRLTAALAAAGFQRAIGVDVSPTMLEKAREIVPADLADRCEFVLNGGSDLSCIESGSVDLVYSCRVLQHMPTDLSHGYVREFIRIAAPEGVVVFQMPSEPSGDLVGTVMRVVPTRWLDRLRKGMQMHGTSPAEVTRVVAECGGVTISIEDDESAGPRWRSQLYVARRRS